MRPLPLVALVLVGGCTAAKAEINIVTAEQAVAKAKEHDADTLAVYEYTMARRYLEKAHEENGYADYKDAVTLAKTAADWADKSIIAIESEGRQMQVQDAGSDLTDKPPVLPPDSPPAEPDLLDDEPEGGK